jgi:hypothetical protein
MKSSVLKEIRLLPPMAIARLGAAAEPMDNFDVTVLDSASLGYRAVTPAPTLIVDQASGEITECVVPREVRFRDGAGDIRPIAPFLEVWALFDGDAELRALTLEDLKALKLSPSDVKWDVHVANHKAYRRTKTGPRAAEAEDDKIDCQVNDISDHARHELIGQCKNFAPGKHIPFGFVQYIKPNEDFPQIRFRLTPAAGRVFGPVSSATKPPFVWDQVYRADGPWVGYPGASEEAQDTIPGAIYYGQQVGSAWISAGYLDDACDGIVRVSLTVGKTTFKSFAHVMCGPPAFAPDSLPIRRIQDELEMHFLGPDNHGEVTNAEVRELLRRAFESVRLMNTTVMNGNTVNGQTDIASTMLRQDKGDFGRAFTPIMAVDNVDNLAVIAVHETLFTTLQTHTPPWFSSAFRRYDEIGDLTDAGRRRMPAMMRNADGRYLVLTRRQYDTILKAAKLSSTQAASATQS